MLLIMALSLVHVSTFSACEAKPTIVVFFVNLVGFLGCKGAFTALTAKELGLVHTAHMFSQFKSECEAFVAFIAYMGILSRMGNFMLPEALAAVCHVSTLAAMQLFDQCHSCIVVFSKHTGMHEYHVLLESFFLQELLWAMAAAILEIPCVHTLDMLQLVVIGSELLWTMGTFVHTRRVMDFAMLA